jgi:hypothetical protein
MLRLDPGSIGRSWFNPATDSIMITFQTENGKQNTVLRPGFPLNEVKHLMARKILRHVNERLRAEGITEPVVALPESFECSARFSTHKLTNLEEWGKVYFHHLEQDGVKILGMSVYRHLIDLLGIDFVEAAAGKHVTSPHIEVGMSLRRSPETTESKQFASDMTFAWTDHTRRRTYQAIAGNR